MKRIIYLAVIAAAGMVLASCQPEVLHGGSAAAGLDNNAVQSAFKIDGQFADAACTQPQADGNFIKYHTEPAVTVQISNLKNGAKVILATGATGVFNITPKRGSDTNQPFHVEAINQDASIAGFDSSVNVFVPGELDPELKLLLGDGVKSWGWHFTDGATCWGNAGNTGAGANFTWNTVDGKWWGPDTPDGLMDQLSHAKGGVATGAEANGAYMTFDEDGNITSFKPDGTQIAKSTYSIKNYDPSRSSGWEIGKLVTSEAAVLFPFSINEGGKEVTEFDLMYLDENYMSLVYTKGNGAGSWGEITFWMFQNKSGYNDALNGGSQRSWTWNSNGNAFWGNAGSTGAGANFTAGVVDGQWWGVTSTEEFLGQLSHAPGGAATGAENTDAYMVFDVNGTVTSYAADGSKIASSDYEVSDFDEKRSSGWQLGKLTAPGILFPYSINTSGASPANFSIMYIDADNLTLVDDKSDVGGWGEITFWLFKAKH